MKITISVPDELFAQAEAEARRQGITRSALFQAALREYLMGRSVATIGEADRKS
jgi:metal-responsive CopG/Arc/MetJ family transcriptional regulator